MLRYSYFYRQRVFEKTRKCAHVLRTNNRVNENQRPLYIPYLLTIYTYYLFIYCL